jgi:hypothetical protein
MRRIVFTVAAVVLCAVPALAQPAPWQPERLTAGWTFTPGFVFGTMRDSNVAVQSRGNPHVAATNILLNPRGELDFNGRHTHFNAGYSGSMEQYRHLNALDRYEQRARFDVRNQRTSRLLLTAGASFTDAPTTDRLDIGGDVLPFIAIGARLFNASGGFTLALSERTNVQGTYQLQDIHFDRTVTSTETHPFLFTGHSQSPGVRVMHQLTSRLSVGAGWQYRHANVDGGLQTIDIQNGTGELTYQASSTTTLSAGAGLSHLRVSTTALATTGPAFHGSVEHHAGLLVLRAAYQRAFVPVFGLGGLTANQWMSGSAYLPFAKGRYFISGSVNYSRTSPVTALGVGYRLDSVWTNASAGYQVARWLRAEGFLTHSHQDSTARGLIDRTRVGIELVTFKPVRID